VSLILELETEVTAFLAELEARIAGLTARYAKAA
jgi:hypothetical protein